MERELSEAGQLASTITWKQGIKDGEQLDYSKDGKKVVKKTLWRDGEVEQVTEYYLNGNPKQHERYDRPQHRQVTAYWDTGKLSKQGDYVVCSYYGARDWCEEGLHRSFFEDGQRRSESNYHFGKLHGSSRTWWPDGKPASVEEYADGTRTKSQRWNESGKLLADEEYEADGSRKLKR
jgi:antitoxin component YwqK of YwqJK toxin-antitoxin module